MKHRSTQDIRQLLAKDVMNPDVLTVQESFSVQDAANFLIKNEISGAPVIDSNENVVGVISLTDIARESAEQGERTSSRFLRNYYMQSWEDELEPEEMEQLVLGRESHLVRDAMTPSISTISQDAPVSQIAESMIEGRVHRLFVTENDRLVGIVTTLDILKLLAD